MRIDDERKKKAIEIAFEENREEARRTLASPDRIERLLQQLEAKLKLIPTVGDKLACVPILASLLRSYIRKEYTSVPMGSILAIVCALLYFVSPIDLIPDAIPVIGLADDVAVIAVCWNLVESDVREYERWRRDNMQTIEQ